MTKDEVLKLKPGDKIRRINCDWLRVKKGDICTFKKLNLYDFLKITERGYNMYFSNFEVMKEEKHSNAYTFRDEKISFRKLCVDAIEDNTPSFLIVGDNHAYVGLIHSGKSVGVTANIEDFYLDNFIGVNFMQGVPDLPYGVFEIPLNKVPLWIKKLEKYSKDYKNWVKDIDKQIKDRDRKKDISKEKLYKFKVIQF